VRSPGGGHKPEFAEWRWERLERVPDLIVPFKREVYQQVVSAFSGFARAVPRPDSRASAAQS
jgi:putative (di)nucleoside polyphosphate hydrolase